MTESRCSAVGMLGLLAALMGASATLAQQPEPGNVEETKPVSEKVAAAQEPPTQEQPTQEPGRGRLSEEFHLGLQRPDEESRPPVFEDRIVVNEVLLDVLVTDKNGDVVTGLGIDDFVVIEDGTLIRPDSVTFYGDPASLRASGPERSDRLFIFFFHHQKDQSTFQRSAQNRMARDAQKWLETELLPNDQVAVLSFDLDLWLHQDFTRDKEKILAAVENAARGKPTRQSRGSAAYRPDPATRATGDSPSLFVNIPRYRDFKSQTRTFQEALELVAKAAGGVVGRKNMLLFSHGFGQIGGATELHSDSEIYKRLDRALNGSNVAVYGFDVVGIRSGDPMNASYGSLSKISYDTGGRYFERDTNFLSPLREVAHETVGYYLISYRSAYERGTSGYRQVEIGTPRGKFLVRGRSGYQFGPVRDRR